MVRTFCPISPKQEERLIAVVDLPTPPFWFAIAIVLPKICIASFHLFVFHLQFFLFTGNDLPALLSKNDSCGRCFGIYIGKISFSMPVYLRNSSDSISKLPQFGTKIFYHTTPDFTTGNVSRETFSAFLHD